jgi:propanol-preferring alcohol dehydrogenase
MTGICFSDLHYMAEDIDMSKMKCLCPGHEGAGVIVKVGSKVAHLKVGQRAGIKPIWNICHICEDCRQGRETHCTRSEHTGLTVEGTYNQYVKSPALYTTLIPDAVPDEFAAPIMCSGATVLKSLKESGLKAGQWVVIPGAGGGVGHFGVQFARAMGLRVIAVDVGESKRKLCIDTLGAEKFIDFTLSSSVEKEVLEITGRGAHGVIVTASHKSGYERAPYMVRPGGVVMAIGISMLD